jgi:hypothetical protein
MKREPLELLDILEVRVTCTKCGNIQPFLLENYENIKTHGCDCGPLANDKPWMQQAAKIAESIAIVKSAPYPKFKLELLVSAKA